MTRLKALADAFLEGPCAGDHRIDAVGLAEARRFPDLATSVSRMARGGQRGGPPASGRIRRLRRDGRLPAFAPDRLPETARRFKEMIFLPIVLRALFGEDLAALRAEIGPHVAESVAFFLAACRYGGG